MEKKDLALHLNGATMTALMTDRGYLMTDKMLKILSIAAILAKLRPQLDAFQTKSKIPAADAPQTTFVLDGLAENTVQIGQHGKIVFTLDGKQFNANQRWT